MFFFNSQKDTNEQKIQKRHKEEIKVPDKILHSTDILQDCHSLR